MARKAKGLEKIQCPDRTIEAGHGSDRYLSPANRFDPGFTSLQQQNVQARLEQKVSMDQGKCPWENPNAFANEQKIERYRKQYSRSGRATFPKSPDGVV